MPAAAAAATSRWCGFRVAAYLSPWSDSCVCFVLVIYNNMRNKQHRLLHLSQLRVIQPSADERRRRVADDGRHRRVADDGRCRTRAFGFRLSHFHEIFHVSLF